MPLQLLDAAEILDFDRSDCRHSSAVKNHQYAQVSSEESKSAARRGGPDRLLAALGSLIPFCSAKQFQASKRLDLLSFLSSEPTWPVLASAMASFMGIWPVLALVSQSLIEQEA
jgi:hypothetical protein